MESSPVWGLLFCLVPVGLGFRTFENSIPNGGWVPHPCKDNTYWRGLGHVSSLGSGARNVFGIDFAAENFTWTTALCLKDSDGDGRTNGQELGDPDCIWKPFRIPQYKTNITHPAICEPVDSHMCLNKTVPATSGVTSQELWLQEECRPVEFKCDSLNKTDDVRTTTIRLPLTSIPAQVTTYKCTILAFEDFTQDYHVIAYTPYINNSYAMHHMNLYGCPDDMPISGPFKCVTNMCTSHLGSWSLGLIGDCLHEQSGIRLGKTGFKRLLLELHWDNPSLRNDLVDSSGLTLYYTPNLRPHDLSTMVTGQWDIQIPPRYSDWMATSDCTASRTKDLIKNDIYVTSAYNHMHYLGISMKIEHYRNGTFMRYITNDPHYNFDNVQYHIFHDPIVIKPGDMLRTTCHFSSVYQDRTTFFGDGSSEEMCFGMIEYFPAENMPFAYCFSWRTLLINDPLSERGCNWARKQKFIYNFNETQLYLDITSVCRIFMPCTVECRAAILDAMKSEVCFSTRDNWEQVKWTILTRDPNSGWTFLAAIESCEEETLANENSGNVGQDSTTSLSTTNVSTTSLSTTNLSTTSLSTTNLSTTFWSMNIPLDDVAKGTLVRPYWFAMMAIVCLTCGIAE